MAKFRSKKQIWYAFKDNRLSRREAAMHMDGLTRESEPLEYEPGTITPSVESMRSVDGPRVIIPFSGSSVLWDTSE